jgi:hypothetical protein
LKLVHDVSHDQYLCVWPLYFPFCHAHVDTKPNALGLWLRSNDRSWAYPASRIIIGYPFYYILNFAYCGFKELNIFNNLLKLQIGQQHFLPQRLFCFLSIYKVWLVALNCIKQYKVWLAGSSGLGHS